MLGYRPVLYKILKDRNMLSIHLHPIILSAQIWVAGRCPRNICWNNE